MVQEFEHEFEEELETEQEAISADALDVSTAAEEQAAVERMEDNTEITEDEEETEEIEESEDAAAPIATSFGTVTDRLSEIAEVMEDSTMPLDDALDLLEEAVALGMQASSLLESDMDARNAESAEENEATESEVAEDEAAESEVSEEATEAPEMAE